MPYVVGVDSSTQSTKVEVRDLDTGALLGHGRATHPATTPPRSEQDPSAWWAAFETAHAEAMAPLGSGVGAGVGAGAGSGGSAAIAVGGQQHGMVVLDDAGSVIRPAKLWNDTESAPDAAWLLGRLEGGAAAWAAACGSVPVAAFTITKLSWLHRSEPEAWQRVSKVLLPHDWLTWRLCGRFVTDRGDASGTGYWSAATGQYRHDLLSIVDRDRDWSSALPQVLGPLEAAGSWQGALVAPGTGDNMAAALGIGLRPGDVVVSIGTSGTVYSVSAAPTADASGAVAGFADASGHFLPLVCTLNATKVTGAVGRLLGVDLEALDALAIEAARAGGSEGLALLPYFDGERTPNRPSATGMVGGIRSDVSRGAFALAAFEGVVCGLLDGLDALSAAGVDVGGALHVVGGGARSQAYRSVLAWLTGRPVVVPAGDEHVALGACVQAAAVAQQCPPAEVFGAWSVGGRSVTEPPSGGEGGGRWPGDPAEVRSRYRALRDAT